MTDPASQDRAAFRAMLIGLPPFSVDAELPGLPAEIRAAGFSPIAGRVEITATFSCVCDSDCPAACYACIACSATLPVPEIPGHVIEEAARRTGETRGEEDEGRG